MGRKNKLISYEKSFHIFNYSFLAKWMCRVRRFAWQFSWTASNSRVLQSSLNSAISYGVKNKTGKTPLGYMLLRTQKKKSRKKKENVSPLLKAQNQNFAQLLKKQISLTNTVVKNEKVLLKIVKKHPNNDKTKNVISRLTKYL